MQQSDKRIQKTHTCLLPHKFMPITCKKYRNASEIQFTK